MARSLLVLGLLALATQAGALNAPVRMGSSAKQTSPSMDRRAALSSIIAGAVIASGAAPAMAGLPEVVKCPAPQNVCDSWKEGKKPSPTFAEVRSKSAFFGKDGLLNSVPKVKGVLLQSTNYTPK